MTLHVTGAFRFGKVKAVSVATEEDPLAEESTLCAFRSTTGRTYLSFVPPPADFPLAGEVERVSGLELVDAGRGIPFVNWNAEKPAVLYRKHAAPCYAIGFPDLPAPEGYQSLGSEFAFIRDESYLQRALSMDKRTDGTPIA